MKTQNPKSILNDNKKENIEHDQIAVMEASKLPRINKVEIDYKTGTITLQIAENKEEKKSQAE